MMTQAHNVSILTHWCNAFSLDWCQDTWRQNALWLLQNSVPKSCVTEDSTRVKEIVTAVNFFPQWQPWKCLRNHHWRAGNEQIWLNPESQLPNQRACASVILKGRLYETSWQLRRKRPIYILYFFVWSLHMCLSPSHLRLLPSPFCRGRAIKSRVGGESWQHLSPPLPSPPTPLFPNNSPHRHTHVASPFTPTPCCCRSGWLQVEELRPHLLWTDSWAYFTYHSVLTNFLGASSRTSPERTSGTLPVLFPYEIDSKINNKNMFYLHRVNECALK